MGTYGRLEYSVPANYKVETVNGAQGLRRITKKDTQWLYPPQFSTILVSKTFGRIMVAYTFGVGDNSFFRLATYNQKPILNMPIYDILFGENCLWVYIQNSKGDIEWCCVNEDMQGGRFVGDIEFIERDAATSQMPFHIPIGTKYYRIKDSNGSIKRIDLQTGDISDDPEYIRKQEREARKKLENTPVDKYVVKFDNEAGRVLFVNKLLNKTVLQSNIFGDFEMVKDMFIPSLLNLSEDDSKNIQLKREVSVSKEIAERFVRVSNMFESFFDCAALVALHRLVLTKTNGNLSGEKILELLEDELGYALQDVKGFDGHYSRRHWYKDNSNNYWKIIIVQTVVCVLFKNAQSQRITSMSYPINPNDMVFTAESLTAIVQAIQSFDGKPIISVEINDIEKEDSYDAVDDYNSNRRQALWCDKPYVVHQKEKKNAVVGGYKYGTVEIRFISATAISKDLEQLDDASLKQRIQADDSMDFNFAVVLCKNFTYKPTQKTSTGGGWVRTQHCLLMALSEKLDSEVRQDIAKNKRLDEEPA